MPINIPMIGRANTVPSIEAADILDVNFVPPHIMEQQKVGFLLCPDVLLHACRYISSLKHQPDFRMFSAI